MMNVIFLVVLAIRTVPASELDATFETGVEAYKQSDFKAARQAFQSILDSGYVSPDLYYNLGNTAFRQKDYGHAVYFYCKAIKLDPAHDDARFNLSLTRPYLVDRIIDAPDFVLFDVVRRLFYSVSVTVLYVVVFIAWSAFWIVLAVHLHRAVPLWMRTLLGTVSVLLMTAMLTRLVLDTRQQTGIVLAGSTDIKSEPLEKASTLFILHAGTEVHLIGHEVEWLEIKLADGKRGWIRRPALGIL